MAGELGWIYSAEWPHYSFSEPSFAQKSHYKHQCPLARSH